MFNFSANSSKIIERFHAIRQKRFFKHGLPFLILLLVGSFGLEHFASVRYQFRKNEMFSEEALKKYGVRKKKVTLDEEYEKLKQMDLDAWENIRGPRPWEEPQQNQQKSS